MKNLNNMEDIKYLPGIQAGQKIDLSKFDKKKPEKIFRPEVHLDNLKQQLVALAAEVNGEFGDFLDAEGQIILIGRDAVSDAALVEQQEEGFALELGKSREDWRRDKDLNPANLTEMALTLVLHKFLKEDFIIARASSYDDYNNGVDQVVIDKKTGAVVCGFDEVITHFKDRQSPKKEGKLEEKMLAGGARLKYGATVIDNRLERRPLRNIPAFYLSLTKEDLIKILSSLKPGNEISRQEEDVFNHLVESLDRQFISFSSRQDLRPELAVNLEKFKNSLEKIKSSLSKTGSGADKQINPTHKAAA